MTPMYRTLAAPTIDPVSARTDIDETWQRCCQSFCRYFAIRTGGNDHLVDDLMQQLWLKSRIKRGDLRSTEAEPWLWRIAQNLLREHRRKHQNNLERRVIADPSLAGKLARQFDHEEMPLTVLERREVHDQLLLALTELPNDEQELLIGRYFEGRSQRELAGALEISERAVEGRLYRARLALRNKLEHLNPEE